MRSLLEGFLRYNHTEQPYISLFYEERCRSRVLWIQVCPCCALLCWWSFPSPTGLHIQSGCYPGLRLFWWRSCLCKDLHHERNHISVMRIFSIWQESVRSRHSLSVLWYQSLPGVLHRLSCRSDRMTDLRIPERKLAADWASGRASAGRNLSQS